MDVRLFKLLVLVTTEAILGLLYLFEYKFFGHTRIGSLIVLTLRFAMATFPVLMILPEDNWVWLLEEDLRSRKISLRSKAVKHVHLSLLYFLAMGYPVFLVCISLFVKWAKYRFLPSWIMGGAAIIFGIYCSYLHFRNVKKNDALFAVGWDRKSAFIEIFIGLNVSRNVRFFFSGINLFLLIMFFISSFLAAPVYYKYFAATGIIFDKQQFIVMQTFFCTIFSISIWVMSMYLSFQIFFTRNLEAWIRDKSGGDTK